MQETVWLAEEMLVSVECT